MKITPEEHAALLKQPCVYCGGPLNESGHGLDRKEWKQGYTLDNTVPCCVVCNRIKNKYLSHEEMVVAMQAVMALRNEYEQAAA